jgi:hypothetical protein
MALLAGKPVGNGAGWRRHLNGFAQLIAGHRL